MSSLSSISPVQTALSNVGSLVESSLKLYQTLTPEAQQFTQANQQQFSQSVKSAYGPLSS